MIKVCVDVDYRADEAMAAAVLFRNWDDDTPAGEVVRRVAGIEPYVPGAFYRRELPCLLAVLADVPEPVELVVIDGYVWVGDESQPGLGARLHQALGGQVPVIGVAKTQFTSTGSRSRCSAARRPASRCSSAPWASTSARRVTRFAACTARTDCRRCSSAWIASAATAESAQMRAIRCRSP